MTAHQLPDPCSRCGRPFTAADVARRAGVALSTARKWLSGELLYGDSPDDRYSRLWDKVATAVDSLERGEQEAGR